MENNSEGLPVKEKHKKEKETKAGKWWLFFILVLTVLVSLFFYLMLNRTNMPKEERGVFGPKVYEF